MIVIILALVSPILWDYDSVIAGMNTSERLQPPSKNHIFGTDNMGRDLFARICYGARYSLLIALLVVGINVVLGVSIGSIAGHFGGRVEYLIMRVVEIFLMIPSFMLVVVFVAVFGVSLNNLILALGLVTVPAFVRTARASVLSISSSEYIEAARSMGAGELYIIFRHVIPNTLSPSLVQATTRFGSAIIDAAAFSFIGLGVPSPLPEWGALLSASRSYLRSSPYLVIFPGLAIMISVLAINLVGDGLRDALDPKLKR
jgi:peptide/nickel transport system permease protein